MKCSFKVLVILSFFVNFLWIWRYLAVVNNGLIMKRGLHRNESSTTTGTDYFEKLSELSLNIINSTTLNTVNFVPTQQTLELTKKFSQTTPDQRPACKYPSERLNGPLRIDFDEINKTFYDLNHRYKEENKTLIAFETELCRPILTVAIIIPYRDRKLHLDYLVGHLHPILERQLLRYQIFVVEQVNNFTFNKGRLMNTGFEYARKHYPMRFDCYIFHDVDMLPENDENIYRCHPGDNMVLHLSCALNKFKYHSLCCGMTVGGVLAFNEKVYISVNGFPNDYWGWGGEDDDMNARLKKKKIKVTRPQTKLCRYFMIEHKRDKLNGYVPDKVNARVGEAQISSDMNGLNSLHTSIVKVEPRFLYVHVFVDVGLPD